MAFDAGLMGVVRQYRAALNESGDCKGDDCDDETYAGYGLGRLFRCECLWWRRLRLGSNLGRKRRRRQPGTDFVTPRLVASGRVAARVLAPGLAASGFLASGIPASTLFSADFDASGATAVHAAPDADAYRSSAASLRPRADGQG